MSVRLSQFSGPYSKKVEELMKMARDYAKVKGGADEILDQFREQENFACTLMSRE